MIPSVALEVYCSEMGEAGSARRIGEATVPYLTRRQGEYTVEDYRKLPEDVRAELIDGVLTFMEAPTFTHQELITELLFEIKMFIRENKGPCRVLPAPLDVQLDCDDRTMVQPDIALICRSERITRKGIYGAPDFCIEVVSDSSRKRDYGIKMQKYMNAGVREYWIVDRKREKIVCYWFEGRTLLRLRCIHSGTGCRSGFMTGVWRLIFRGSWRDCGKSDGSRQQLLPGN